MIVSHTYRCERCSSDATVVQSRYRGNSDDRNGPKVLYRCARHAVAGLPSEQLVVAATLVDAALKLVDEQPC